MAAVVAVSKREVDALVEALVHRAPHQRLDRFAVVVNRVFYILNFAAVHQIPEPPLKILFFNRRDLLGNVAVEAVGHIFAVGNILDDAVLFAELLNLQSAQALGGRAVERV